MNVSLREARQADRPALLALEQGFVSDRMSARAMRYLMTAPSCRFRVACQDAQILGASVLLLRRNSRWARLYSLVVDPRARGQGIGQRLIADAENAARAAGLLGVSLEVRADNLAARRLYARLGYRRFADLPAYYDDGAPGIRLRKPFA